MHMHSYGHSMRTLSLRVICWCHVDIVRAGTGASSLTSLGIRRSRGSLLQCATEMVG